MKISIINYPIKPEKERKVRMLNQVRIQDEKIISQVFSHLNISQERLLGEKAFLLASQQASYETENDWMD